MLAEQIRNNVAVALDTLRANKLRSGLTILGVVMGVSTVMMMAAIVGGIKAQIISTIEIAGPTTFYVLKAYSETPVNPDNPPKWIRMRPDLSDDEARLIKRLPEISYSAIWGQAQGRLEYKGVRTQPLLIYGADEGFSEIYGGDLIEGRWFTQGEMLSSAPVVVLEETQLEKFSAVRGSSTSRFMSVAGLCALSDSIRRQETSSSRPVRQPARSFRISRSIINSHSTKRTRSTSR